VVAGADGNMKARRGLCANWSMGIAKPLLHVARGLVHRGCTNSPGFASRYCTDCGKGKGAGAQECVIGHRVSDDDADLYHVRTNLPAERDEDGEQERGRAQTSWTAPEFVDAELIIQYHARQVGVHGCMGR
jgi:hypothetical protein